MSSRRIPAGLVPVGAVDPSELVTCEPTQMSEMMMEIMGLINSGNIIIDIVCYHHPCNDGMLSAAIVKYVYSQTGTRIQFVECTYGAGKPDIEMFRGKNVVMLDCSYDREFMEAIQRVASVFVVLDHHAQAEANLINITYKHFDSNQSAALMTWNFFNGVLGRQLSEIVPYIIQIVTARDLNCHEFFENSKIYMSKMMQQGHFRSLKDVSDYFEECLTHPFGLPDISTDLIEHEGAMKVLRLIGSSVHKFERDGLKYGVFACQYPPTGGDIAMQLIESNALHIVCSYFVNFGTGKYHYSFRSQEHINVTKISFGGLCPQGHPQAAGIQTEMDPFQLFRQE